MSATPAIAETVLSPDEQRRRARRTLIGFMAIVIGSFMALLDIQIVASSINQLQAGLLASADEIQWVQTAYLIAEVIGIPLSGVLSRALSTRGYFIFCALGFAIASAGCAFAWNLGSMVFFRAFQGFMGAGMIPLTFSVIILLFPADKRMFPLIIAGLTGTAAPALGPTIGGYISDVASWHWLFLVNLPPALIACVVVARTMDIDKPDLSLLRKLDLQSLFGLAAMLGGFEYLLEEGPRHDWFDDSTVLYSLLTAVVGACIFFWRARVSAHPAVRLYALRNWNFAIAAVMIFIIGLCMYVNAFLTPMFLGQVRGYAPMQIGKVVAVQGTAMFFAAPLGPVLLKYLGPRSTMMLGLLMMAAGALMIRGLTADWGFAEFALPQILMGAGVLFGTMPLNQMALGLMPAEEVKDASGLYNLMRNIGGAIGLALLVSAMNRQTWQHWQHLAESTRLTRPPVREHLTTMSHALQPLLGESSPAVAVGTLAQQMQQQAAVLSFADMYWLLALGLCLTVPMVLLLRAPAASANSLDLGAH